jgi:hypothetical protein
MTILADRIGPKRTRDDNYFRHAVHLALLLKTTFGIGSKDGYQKSALALAANTAARRRLTP